jgi:predicted MFS family arabinose efflux permease
MMNKTERTAVISLASVMSLRMLGLFMVLPVFSLYAIHLTHSTPSLVGLSMGIYGLTQALFQIPFGAWSDHVGRKKVNVLGLLIFISGSILVALSDSIYCVILGRALQGAGAVGSTIIALIADFTREDQRSKAMAIVGMSIGMSFSLAMLLGPALMTWINVPAIFWLSAGLGVLAILVLLFLTPHAAPVVWHADAEPEIHQFSHVLKNSALMRLNAGIFLLHATFTASFVVIPISLAHLAGLAGHAQWKLYLPILLLAFAGSIPLIVIAEKKHKLKQIFIGAILMLMLAELLLWFFAHQLLLSALSLLLFFTAFSTLEAFLPSLVSRTAPRNRKGTALGLYSCSQFFGIFVGGTAGGWLYGYAGLTDVYLFGVIMTAIWAIVAIGMPKMQPQQIH